MKRNVTKALFIAASLCVTLGASGAHAGEIEFRYNQHELETSFGVEQLYQRLVKRAEGACVTSGRRGFWQMRAEAKCVKLLTNDLVLLIDNPRLAAKHAETIHFAQQQR